MLVKDFMTPVVITVKEDQSMLEARELMRGKDLRSLPVVDDIKRIRGIITAEDVGKASPSEGSTLSRYEANYLLGRLKVRDVMSRSVVTVNADDSIEYVAYNLYKTKVNALPVVDDVGKLCGIISQNDVFRAFVEIMSVDKPCTRISFVVKDQVGVLADVATLFKENNANIISLLCKANEDGTTEITIRAVLANGMDIIEQLREAGYEVTDIMSIHGVN